MTGLALLAAGPSYEWIAVIALGAGTAAVILTGAWLAIQPSRHRRTKLALLGIELVLLAGVGLVDIVADASIRAHARRQACAGRLGRLAIHLGLARRLDARDPKGYPPTLDALTVVPDFAPDDAICPMDGGPYDYRVSADGAEAWVEGRPVADSAFVPVRGHHRLRVAPDGWTLEWVAE